MNIYFTEYWIHSIYIVKVPIKACNQLIPQVPTETFFMEQKLFYCQVCFHVQYKSILGEYSQHSRLNTWEKKNNQYAECYIYSTYLNCIQSGRNVQKHVIILAD